MGVSRVLSPAATAKKGRFLRNEVSQEEQKRGITKRNHMAAGTATPGDENRAGRALREGDFGSFCGHAFSMSCGYFQKK
jgi:hypothetical protein